MKQNVMKRTLAGILAVLTVAAYMPANVGGFLTESTGIVMGVSAEEATSVSTAGALKTAVEAGESVQLAANITLTETLNVTEDVTIDLNGYNITANGCRAFHVQSGTLTLSGSGTVSSTHTDGDKLGESSSVIRVGNGSATTKDGSTPAGLYVGKNVRISTAWCYGISVFGSSTTETVDVHGKVNVTGRVSAISGNGNPWNSGTTINIYPGAEVIATNSVAIYHPQAGDLNITGGTISGLGGIEAKAGDATVSVSGNDTVIEATANKTSHGKNNNGTSTLGYAISAVENSGYTGNPSFNISGGTINGPVEVVKDDDVVEEKKAAITITGGTFNTDVSKYVAPGYVQQNGTVVAQIVNEQTLIDAVNNGGTIKLDGDIALTKTLEIAADTTINLNGHNITATNYRAFHVKSGTLTLSGSGTVSSTGSNLNADSSVIRVGDGFDATDGTGTTPAVLTVGEDVTISTDKSYGISVFGRKTAETLNVYGNVNVTSDRSAISGNGTSGLGSTEINIYEGASVTSTDAVAIYHPQAGSLNITGGRIEGLGGIEAKAGDCNVSITGSSTSIKATGAVSHAPNNNGTSTTGYAISAVENSGYAGSPAFTISGGTITGPVAIIEDNQVAVGKKGAITITGGTFSTDVSAYVAEGYAQDKDGVVKDLATSDYFTITTIDVNGNKTATKVYPSIAGKDTFTVPKAVYMDGMSFDCWCFYDKDGKPLYYPTIESDAQSIADDLLEKGEDFAVETKYSPVISYRQLRVVDGVITSGPKGSYSPTQAPIETSTVVKVTADTTANFSYWVKVEGEEEEEGTIVSYNPTYSFYMPDAEVVLKAVYNVPKVEPKGTGVIESVKSPNTKKLSFVSVLNIPDGCKMLKAGVVAKKTLDLSGDLTSANATYVRYTDTSKNSYKTFKFTWTKNTSSNDEAWTVRPYLEYKDKSGNVQTIYGDAISKSISQL